MNTTTQTLRRLARQTTPEQQEGQGLAEYSLIILLVALAVVAALGAFGGNLAGIYTFIMATLPF